MPCPKAVRGQCAAEWAQGKNHCGQLNVDLSLGLQVVSGPEERVTMEKSTTPTITTTTSSYSGKYVSINTVASRSQKPTMGKCWGRKLLNLGENMDLGLIIALQLTS